MRLKITKKRLIAFFTYDLIKTLVATVAVCFALVLVFNAIAVKPSDGQEFTMLIDVSLTPGEDVNSITGELMSDDEDGFSYEILTSQAIEIQPNGYTEEYMLNNVYVELGQDDVLVLGKTLMESYVARLNALDLLEVNNDVKNFLISNNLCNDQGVFNRDNVRNYFLTTRKGDPRFKTEEDKAIGVECELKRLEKLWQNADYLQRTFTAHPELLVEKEISYAGITKNVKVALDFSKVLGKGNNHPENFFTCAVKEGDNTTYTTSGVYILLGNTIEKSGDLRYESLAFLVKLLKTYTDYV